MRKSNNISKDDQLFYIINGCILLFGFLIIALPILNVVASSLSTPSAVIRGKVNIMPVGFTIDAYKEILKSEMLITGYKNSIIYTFIGTTINIVLTIMAAYPLSVKDLEGRKYFTGLFVFTMIFTAPLIPTYINIKNLGLLNSMWALVLPGAISIYNMIIARTYFQNSIPEELKEAAKLDGASDIQTLLMVVLPLSKSIIAVLILFYAVFHWNSYFEASIYITSESKLTLQVVLRNIMSTVKALQEMADTTVGQSERAGMIEILKYAVIVFGSLPVIVLYPFIQKHFTKGIMLGSIKG